MSATIHELPGARRRRVLPADAVKQILGAADDLKEIAREHEHDPVGIMQAVSRILLAVEKLREP